nr:CD97 antigen-like isoform X1 [Ciona intestinalis]|eukprot:XP_026694834.1 CD97 antigen-like isoform X1 [Ciona intestinalis]
MVAYLLFMIGVPSVGNKTTCTIVAVLLHYTFLTSWFWMGIYSNRLYNSLVKIFSKPANHYMVKSSCLAYGLPLIIVGINLAVTVGYLDKKISRPLCPNDTPPPPSSLYIADNMCWIHQETLYFGFLLIVGLILLMNCIIFTILVYKLIIKRNEVQSSAKKRSKQQNLVMAITMCLSMGLTWVFGFLMLLSYDPGYQSVMSWLFTISIALQGLLVFYLTCVRNIEMFNFWWKPIKSIVTRQKYSPSKTALSSQSSRYTESQTI